MQALDRKDAARDADSRRLLTKCKAGSRSFQRLDLRLAWLTVGRFGKRPEMREFRRAVSVDGQTSLLVGSRSGAERRWVERNQAQSASGCFVRRRYSACPVDSCRIVYFVGQPTVTPCGGQQRKYAA